MKPPYLPLARPSVSSRDQATVAEVLSSDILARGPALRLFEERMAEYCQTKHAIAVNSGTAALHLLAQGLGLAPGDEVITTPFSFVASSNVILYQGATPRFVDIDPDTLNLDVQLLDAARSPKTRGILAVDVFGLPADWPHLSAFASAHDLFLIADACESIGATINGRPMGSWGDGAAFGFYPNKQLTTGEGGCLTTNSDSLAERCRSLRNQGRTIDPRRMDHVKLGYNYRMNEMTAALGASQVKRLPQLLQRRTQIAEWYTDALSTLCPELILPLHTVPNRTRSWFVYVIRLGTAYSAQARDHLQKALHEAGIGTAPYFPCIHLQPYYRRRFGFKPGDFPVAEHVSERSLALPFYPQLTQADVDRVAETIRTLLPQLPTKQSKPFLTKSIF